MRKTTIFTTPLHNSVLHHLARVWLRLLGWRIVGTPPDVPRYVLIGAPHTSNWDFFYMLLVCFSLRLQVYWMGKNSLFPWPLGGLMRWLGGIPVDRSKPGGLVEETVAAFAREERLIVVIPPEGTRSRVRQWKTGFYRIAAGAGVPIALGYLDFRKKEAGLATLFTPSGDLDADMVKIRSFYSGVVGRNPEMFSAD